jgi:hypothetical protein
MLPVPGVRGFLLHHRLGAASERRRSDGSLKRKRAAQRAALFRS